MSASSLHKNNAGKSVFQISLKGNNYKIPKLLWKYMQKRGDEYHVFFQLCESGDVQGMEYFLERLECNGELKATQESSEKHKKRFLEFNKFNDEEHFPFLLTLKKIKKEASSKQIAYHKKINKHILATCASNGENALMLALVAGFIDISKELISVYDQINDGITQSTRHKANALMYAARFGHTEIVKMLLPFFHRKRKVTVQRDDGLNALMLACRYGEEDVVKLLLPYFANERKIDETSTKGETAGKLAKTKYPHISEMLEIYRYTMKKHNTKLFYDYVNINVK